MLKGKRVFISEVYRLKMFYPSFKIVKSIPILVDEYIYTGHQDWDFGRFPRSIWLTRARPEVNLDKIESVVELLASFRRVSNTLRDRLLEIKDLEEFWRRVAEFYYFGLVQEEEVEEQVFKLFSVLNASNREVFEVYSKIKIPRPVVISSLLTMLMKAQSYRDYQGQASSYYIKLLYTMNRALKDVKQKFVVYWLSDQSELQFLYLLFSLKR